MVQLSTDNDFETLLNTNKQVIVKYFADWCGSCKLFAPKFKRNSNDEVNADILFLEVNAEENEKARKMGGVDNLPYLASFKWHKLQKNIKAIHDWCYINYRHVFNIKSFYHS